MSAITRTVSAALPTNIAARLQRIADAEGKTLHRYVVEALVAHANRTAIPERTPLQQHVSLQGIDPFALTETIVVEIRLPLAKRLHTAARQLTDPSGKGMAPGALARELLIHECERTTDIIRRMAQHCDPKYVDHVPFQGKLRERAYVQWHLLAIKCSFPTRQSVLHTAKVRELSVSDLIRSILDQHLNPLNE